jgi:hypothetical protein
MLRIQREGFAGTREERSGCCCFVEEGRVGEEHEEEVAEVDAIEGELEVEDEGIDGILRIRSRRHEAKPDEIQAKMTAARPRTGFDVAYLSASSNGGDCAMAEQS